MLCELYRYCYFNCKWVWFLFFVLCIPVSPVRAEQNGGFTLRQPEQGCYEFASVVPLIIENEGPADRLSLYVSSAKNLSEPPSSGLLASNINFTTFRWLIPEDFSASDYVRFWLDKRDSSGKRVGLIKTFPVQIKARCRPVYLFNVHPAFVGSDEATVLWETNYPLGGALEYGTSSNFGARIELPIATTTHFANLVQLQPGTQYFFRVIANDDAKTVSDIIPFITLPAAEKIENKEDQFAIKDFSMVRISSNAVRLSWGTTIPADSEIDYGIISLLPQTTSTQEIALKHEMVVTDLLPNRLYYFRVKSKNSGFKAVSPIKTFFNTDLSEADSLMVSSVPQDVHLTRHSDRSVLVTWTNIVSALHKTPTVMIRRAFDVDPGKLGGEIVFHGKGDLFIDSGIPQGVNTVFYRLTSQIEASAVSRSLLVTLDMRSTTQNPKDSRKSYSIGDQDEVILLAQERLIALGFIPKRIRIGGYFGRTTALAVRSFQASVEIPSTGILDMQTIKLLLGDVLPLSYFSEGDVGVDVATLQLSLQRLGFFPEEFDPSGYFGLVTRQAVEDFQKSLGLGITGRVDGMTFFSLNRFLNAQN